MRQYGGVHVGRVEPHMLLRWSRIVWQINFVNGAVYVYRVEPYLPTYTASSCQHIRLHPENQRLITQVLANLVNIGIKVFITTHSDYIIKEFSTLIMLNLLLELIYRQIIAAIIQNHPFYCQIMLC
jgi:hypothetical protein